MKTKSLSIFSLSALCVLGLTSHVLAQPGSGIRLGDQTVLIPSVSGSYNYDSNVNLRRRALDNGGDELDNSTSDSFYKYSASLLLTRLAGNRRFTTSAWYGEQMYSDFSELDGENYGVSGGHFWTRPGGRTSISADASFAHIVDRTNNENAEFYDSAGIQEVESISERVERDVLNAKLKLIHDIGTDIGSVFIFGYDDTSYKNDRYNDRTGYDYILELNYRVSEKTKSYGQIGYSVDDDEGFEDNAEKPFFLLGVRYTATEKLRFDTAVGYEKYTRTPVDGTELEDSGLKYSVNANYQATAKSAVRVSARNGYDSVASGSSNSRRENAVSLQYRHQTTRRLNQSVLISWREDDYLTPITIGEDEIDEVKETIRYQYSVDYQTVRPWLSLFANASYEDGSSNLPNDSYEQTELTLGAKLRY